LGSSRLRDFRKRPRHEATRPLVVLVDVNGAGLAVSDTRVAGETGASARRPRDDAAATGLD